MRGCGIDCGIKGSIALLDTDTQETQLWDTQVLPDGTLDAFWVFNLISELKADYAVIENVFRPLSLIRMAGEYQAICKLLDLPLYSVAVCTWKIELLGENTANKQKSITVCKKIFPNADINRLSPKQKKLSPNADRAEALLLSYYQSLKLKPSQKKKK